MYIVSTDNRKISGQIQNNIIESQGVQKPKIKPAKIRGVKSK